MNLVDSSGWIEFFLAGPNGPLFKPVVEQRNILLVPVIALFEVHKVLIRKVPPDGVLACLNVMRLGRREGDAGALADGGHVLAGEAADEDVHGVHVVPVDGGDVAEVRHAGPMAREDTGDGFVEFGEPHGVGVEDVFDGKVEAAVAAEQRPDPESWYAAVVEVVHEERSG